MTDHFALRLQQFVRFSDADKRMLADLSSVNVRSVEARRDLIREGEDPHAVNLVLEGWGIRHKMLEDGRRQIVAFLIPGDLCDLNLFILKQMDHSIGALTPLRVAQLPRALFEKIYDDYPRITQALHWDSLVSAAIQREWTVNLGQRTAIERIAHLICEIVFRLRAVGLCRDLSCDFPVTQMDLADATGMTAVHVNRTIQELRAQGLISWKRRELRVPDLHALQRVGLFNPNYLHLDREGAHLNAND